MATRSEAKNKKRRVPVAEDAGPNFAERAAQTGVRVLRTLTKPFTQPIETVAGKAAAVGANLRDAGALDPKPTDSPFRTGYESVRSQAPEFNDQNSKQYVTPRPAEETQAQQPAVARQTSFTNADAAQYGTPKRRSLADIPGRDFYGTATFQDRLNRFRENNPEFTPRSLRPNKGYTSNVGGAYDRELAARKARFAMSDALDVADSLNRPGRGGSIRGRKAAADIYQQVGEAQAGLSARPPRQLSTSGLADRANQLTERRLGEEKLRSDQALEYQQLGLKGLEAQRRAQQGERDYQLRNQASIRDAKAQVLGNIYGEQTPEGDNRALSEASQFLDRSQIESPEDVGRAVQFYKLAKPLMEQQQIATAVSPFLARIFDWAKGNAIPLTNQADVKAAIDRFTSGEGPGGVQLDPTDVSARNRQIARQLRYQ